ncbi:MAG: flagellar FlbD family protein [Oscillibacter sp.]|nr:flagellar FlbD family protein [Oscillibacter sp.]
MIQITKLDGEIIRLNENQIEHIAVCPEIKVVLVSGNSCFAKEVRLFKNNKKEEPDHDTDDEIKR